MLRSRHGKALAAVLTASLLGLSGGMGCATAGAVRSHEMDAKRARTHFEMAVDHAQNGQVELALQELLIAERLDPKNPQIQHALGVAYLIKDRPVEAEQHLRRATELTPAYHDARYNLSTLYLNQGRFEESIQQSKLLYEDPTYVSPWRALNNWGWAEYQLGRVAEARKHLEAARDIGRTYWPTFMNLGILEAAQNRPADALRYFSRVLELSPGANAEAEASYRLAEIFVSQGKREQAVGYLRTAVVKAPSDPWGKKSEEYLKLLH
jgi:Tfp pilus assembly protein PilF